MMVTFNPILAVLSFSLVLVGSLVRAATVVVPPAGSLSQSYQHPVIRDTTSTYNVSFESDEFDSLGDLDWRPLPNPYQALSWSNFRVGANKHFIQYSGGKDAFASIPLDTQKNIIHDSDPSISARYNNSVVDSFGLRSLLFGCALNSGIPVECDVDFFAIDAAGKAIANQTAKFVPPFAHLNSYGRLEAGKAALQSIKFSDQFSKVKEVRFSVKKFTVLFTSEPGKDSAVPSDVNWSNSIFLVLDGVNYVTSMTAAPQRDSPVPTLSHQKRGGKHVTDCFDLDGDITFNSFPLPYKDLFYNGFYRSKHLLGYYKEPCTQKEFNASTGHIYAAGVKPYTDPSASVFPSIGIDYFGSKKKDMSIKSFFIGCEQFVDDNSLLDSGAPCTIGILSLVTQKHGDKPQEVHYQEVSIAKPNTAPPEDTGFEYVELIDGDHVTKVYFVLISGDSKAQSAAIILDNLTYYTRAGRWPQTGNRQAKAPGVPKVDAILQAISQGHERDITSQNDMMNQERIGASIVNETIIQGPMGNFISNNTSQQYEYPSFVSRIRGSGRNDGKAKRNITFTFNTPSNVDTATGIFPLTSNYTKPFDFGAAWKGRSQDAEGNPANNVVYNNITWPFAPVDITRPNFAYAEISWASQGSSNWNDSTARITVAPGSGLKAFTPKSMKSGCYPAILTQEDRDRLKMLNNAFECHFTVVGYKMTFKDEPAQHATDLDVSTWKNWTTTTFPKNFRNVDLLEFHATYASTRNVRIFVDDIVYEES
ncbi:hypothetical protein TWF694_005738 [Orbilia ellipsospora]|uniref:Uncharacterized protein n=1 Tax=Orbilia ellipsospora TaxID=2528407 RepID=A0AAV9WRU4_9PEZI